MKETCKAFDEAMEIAHKTLDDTVDRLTEILSKNKIYSTLLEYYNQTNYSIFYPSPLLNS